MITLKIIQAVKSLSNEDLIAYLKDFISCDETECMELTSLLEKEIKKRKLNYYD